MSHRRLGLAVPFAILALLYASCRDRCAAQMDGSSNPGGSPTPSGQKTPSGGQPGGNQNQATQPVGPIVAGPNSTVVAPASNAGNSGLIVAAPGSTVVVQQVQPAAQNAKSNTAGKTNSFSRTKGDQNTIDTLGGYAKQPYKGGNVVNFRGRAGAIDALGILGAGADDDTANAIAIHLGDVLMNEFISPQLPTAPSPSPTLPAPRAAAQPGSISLNVTIINCPTPPTSPAPAPALQYRDPTGSSEFLCFHVVQAAGNIGWGARSILPQMEMLRGQNPILDTAIDRAVTAMQNSPAPQPQNTTQNAGQGMGAGNPTPAGQ